MNGRVNLIQGTRRGRELQPRDPDARCSRASVRGLACREDRLGRTQADADVWAAIVLYAIAAAAIAAAVREPRLVIVPAATVGTPCALC